MVEKLYLKFKKCIQKEIIILFIIGLVCLAQIFATLISNSIDTDSVSIVIRSQLVVIFGYIFSIRTNVSQSYKSKNLQFYIATFVAIITLLILIFSYWAKITSPIRSLSSVRDLLVSSICFIVGLSNNLEDKH